MNTISPREASIFACLTDTVVAPHGFLPPVHQTDAALFFDDWLTKAPKINAIGLRVFVTGLELAPLAMGYGHRLRRLDEQQRASFLQTVEKSPLAPVRQIVKLVKGLAFLCYYGDDGMMKRLGYDADANVARGRELRAREGRP
jgi:hypothetical protein